MRKILNRFSFIILLFLFIFFLSGCTNSVEENLENYYYVMAIGLDSGTDTKTILLIRSISVPMLSVNLGTKRLIGI